MRIRQNITGLIAYRLLGNNVTRMGKSLEKLSAGYRIIRASDDAAGLAVSEKMRTQVKGLEQGNKNALDAVSLVQTAEAGMHEIHSMLQRLRTLSVQSSNATYTSTDRSLMQTEVNQLLEEIDRLASSTQFNEQKVLKNGESLRFHVGANKNEVMTTTIPVVGTSQLSIKGLSISTMTKAETSISSLSNAINSISEQRSNLGAVQNRLEHTLNATSIAMENMVASEARVRDLDIAKEMMEYTKTMILIQIGMAMLSQANQNPKMVLSLL
ncbi:MAG: flagellin [bacterium]|nr:flagellin [bacterium]